MKTITLSDEQFGMILKALDDVEEGAFEYEIEPDEQMVIHVTGWLETEGYVEDDFRCGYGNGTGAWVETCRCASVEITATVYDEDGNAEEVAIDREQENEAKDYLNAAA